MATQTEVSPADLRPPITVQEWGELEGPPYYDLVNGRLEEKPIVSFWHEILLVDLVSLLAPYVRIRNLGRFVVSRANLQISTYAGRQPDLFFIPVAQYHLIGKNVFRGVPPLVVEILSPSNEATDRIDKYSEYASLGVGEYWIIDSPNRRLEVHTLCARGDGSYEYRLKEIVAEDAIFRPTLFPGLEIPLGEIWPTEFEGRREE